MGVALNHRFYFRMFPEINNPAIGDPPWLWKPSHQHLDSISSKSVHLKNQARTGKREWMMTIWCQKMGDLTKYKGGGWDKKTWFIVAMFKVCLLVDLYLRQWSQLADNFGMGWNSCKTTSTGNGTYLNNPIRINLPWSIFHSISKIWRSSEETLKATMVFLGFPHFKNTPNYQWINTFHWKRCRKNDHESCWIVSSLLSMLEGLALAVFAFLGEQRN